MFLLPDALGPHFLEQLKRLSELSLVLLALARPADGSGPRDEHASWAERMAEGLAVDLGSVEPAVRSMVDLHAAPGTRSLLVAFPALEAITGRTFCFHRLVTEALDADTGADTCADLAFARDVAGLEDCRDVVSAELAELIRAPALVPGTLKRSDLYELTHLFFYATKMGRRASGWESRESSWIHERLEIDGRVRESLGDLDLAAESALSLLLAGFPASDHVRRTVARLSMSVQNDGHVSSYPWLPDLLKDGTPACYHPTLVGLAALAEFERKAC
nr:hypothetical protein [Actinomadura terrae]